MTLGAFFCSYFIKSWTNCTTESISWNQPRQSNLHKTTQEIKTTRHSGASTTSFGWTHCTVSALQCADCAVSTRALGAERAEMAPAAHGALFSGIFVPSTEMCAVYSLPASWWHRMGDKPLLKHWAKHHLSCTLFTRSPCQAAPAQSRNSAVPVWCCKSTYHLGQFGLVLCPYPPHF